MFSLFPYLVHAFVVLQMDAKRANRAAGGQ